MSPRQNLVLGLAVAVLPMVVRHYLLMPYPGSQGLPSMGWSYTLSRVTWLTGSVGAALALVGLVRVLRQPGRSWKTYAWLAPTCLLAVGLVAFTVLFSAPWLFREATEVRFDRGTTEALPPETLVMGIAGGSQAKAYPIRLLAYHHRLDDELDGEPIWVTYCTMCRTGKVFQPIVDGRRLSFDLLGAVQYNSIYRDRQTGSFWFQANGRATEGPLAGSRLTELRVDQMQLGRWLELHPDSQVLQPDAASADGYTMFGFDTFDDQRSEPEDPPEWQWVLGVVHDGEARGYAWSQLAGARFLEDRIGDLPLAIHLLPDGVSHRVWDRRLDGRELAFELDEETERLVDRQSGTPFGFDGVAAAGELAGAQLRPVASTVEYRHSFELFSGGVVIEGEGEGVADGVAAEEARPPVGG